MATQESLYSLAQAAYACGDDAIAAFVAQSPEHEKEMRALLRNEDAMRRYAEDCGADDLVYGYEYS